MRARRRTCATSRRGALCPKRRARFASSASNMTRKCARIDDRSPPMRGPGPASRVALRCSFARGGSVGGCPRTPSVSACASLVPYINSVSRAVPFPTRRRPERNAGSFRAGPGAGCAVTRPRARGGASPQGAGPRQAAPADAPRRRARPAPRRSGPRSRLRPPLVSVAAVSPRGGESEAPLDRPECGGHTA